MTEQILKEGTMLAALATTCRRNRRVGEITQAQLAQDTGLSRQAIIDFERAKAWPRDPDRIVNAYAAAIDVNAYAVWTTAARRFAETALEEER